MIVLGILLLGVQLVLFIGLLIRLVVLTKERSR